jgi:aspartate aminotransferase-like enzyme
MDEWGIDVMIGGSQKAFMLPAGLAFLSFSKKAWAICEKATSPRFYFDMRKEYAANQAGESGWSAAVTHIRALDLILELFLSQGMDKVHARIEALSRATSAAVKELGLEIYPKTPSPSLTAIRLPDGIDSQKVRAEMEKRHHIVVMGGQDQLKGKIIRIGHMGAISDLDVLRTIEALAISINELKPGLIQTAQIAAAQSKAKQILNATPAVLI